MRDPTAQGWPNRGERTEDGEIAERWKWAYYDLVRGDHRRRVLKLPKDRTLLRATEEYLEHRRNTVERSTWNADRTAINHLLHFLPNTPLSVIDPRRMQDFFDGMVRKGYNAATLGTYHKSLYSFCKWADFPMSGIKLPDPGVTDVRTLEPHECEAVRAAALEVDRTASKGAPSARLAVELGLSMGLRQGEIFALRWEAIDPAQKAVRVQWQIPKDGTEPKPLKGKLGRTALVMPEWWHLHREATGYIVSAKPPGTRSQRLLITRVLDRCGLKDVGMGFHVLRHSYARHFIERGGRFEELQKSLGHSSIRTTETRYGHFHHDIAVRLARERIYGLG